MRAWLTAILVLSVHVAHAQPVSFQLVADVPVGSKPRLTVTAVDEVSDLRLELERDDGKTFSQRHPRVARGRAVTIPIGDGAAGKASYKGTLTVLVAGKRWTEQLTFETLVRAPLKVTYDAEHLDLDRRVLQFKLSRPATSAELVVIGEDGRQLATSKAGYGDADPASWLSIGWTQPAGTRAMVLRLRVEAAGGLATSVELIPWSVEIEHEDVNFATDSARIEPGEAPKLDASAARIAEIAARVQKHMKLRLYVAGHTDTVGPTAKNRALSRQRALAIARYFRAKGLGLPIAVAGYGEEVPAVATADNVDERANRRVDYVLGPASGAPPFQGPYARVKADWRPLD